MADIIANTRSSPRLDNGIYPPPSAPSGAKGSVQDAPPPKDLVDIQPADTRAAKPGHAKRSRGQNSAPVAAPAPAPKSAKSGAPAAEKEYTVLAYLDGSNDLEPYILQNFKDMESVGSSDQVNIVAQLSRYRVPSLARAFMAETLNQTFQSESFQKYLKQKITDQAALNQVQYLLSQPVMCEKLAFILLQQSPELQVQIDQLTTGMASEVLDGQADFASMMKGVAKQFVGKILEDLSEKESGKAGDNGYLKLLGNLITDLSAPAITASSALAGTTMPSGAPASRASSLFFLEPTPSASLKPGASKSDTPEIVVADKEPKWMGVRRYKVEKDTDLSTISSKPLEDLKFADMADPQTLADFLVWGIRNYPAKHYAILMSDHGAGFLGALEDRGSMLSMPDIRKALEIAEEKTGVKPDVIIFDACLMGQAEVAYELKDRGKYLVASEEVIGGKGLPYTDVLGYLTSETAKGPVTPQQLGEKIIDASAKANTDTTFTLSLLDLEKIEGVRAALDTLAEKFLEGKMPLDQIRQALKETTKYQQIDSPAPPYIDFRDIYDMADRLEQYATDPTVKGALAKVRDAVSETVVREQHQNEEDYQHSHGLSLYAPRKAKTTSGELLGEYGQLDFAKSSKWDEFLAKLTDLEALPPEKAEKLTLKNVIPLPRRS